MDETSPGDESKKSLSDEHDGTTRNVPDSTFHLGHLQFCLKDSQEACPTFKCAILPGTKPTLSEWITCCRSEGEIGFEHVTYHKLTDSDKSLSIILAKYSNSNICGIIIINSTNSVSLSDDIAIKEGDILMPPVYVVSLEDGCELETFIGAREKQSVLIRVVVDITVDMPVDHDPKTVQRVPQRKHSYGKRKLQDLLNEHLFAGGQRINVSANQTEFLLIFSCFHNYEAQIKRDSSCMDKVINILNFPDETFNQDFLFYLLLAYRFKHYRWIYGNTVNNYVDSCITKLEAIADVKGMTNVIFAFIQMGDFEVQFKHENIIESQFKHDNVSVFQLFYDMTSIMLIRSISLNERTSRVIYHRILWIALHIFFGLQVKAEQSALAALWKSELLCGKVQRKLVFSNTVLEEFSKGFTLMKALQLPEDVCFDFIKLAEFLDPSNIDSICVSHIKDLMEASEIVFCQSAKQLQAVLEAIRHNFQGLFDSYKSGNWNWEKYSLGGSRLSAYEEALKFLEYIYGCISELSDEESDEKEKIIEKEIVEWLKLLVANVRILSDDAVIYFEKLQSKQAEVGFSKKYTAVVNELIHDSGMKWTKKFSVSQFCTLFAEMKIWKFEFVEDFLKICQILKTTSLKDSCWTKLLKEISNRFPDPYCKRCIIGLMKRITIAYEIGKRENEFVNDLIRLDLPNLFLTQSKKDDLLIQKSIVDVICSFIQRNALRDIILDQVISIMGLVRSDNHLQSVILAALQKEIVPDIKMIEKLETSSHLELINASIHAACESLNTLSQLSEVDKFYWHFISSCCKHIRPSSGNLAKLSMYSFAINKLGKIFQKYCMTRNINEPVTCEVPRDIDLLSNADIKDYFIWICEIQTVMYKWEEKFSEEQFNYDEILMYSVLLSTIEHIAKAVKTDLVFDVTALSNLKDRFTAEYTKLWLILVKGNKEYGWCTIMDLLSCYDTELSHTIQSKLGDHLDLVKRDSVSNVAMPQQKVSMAYDLLEQEPTIILKLGKSVTLKVLLCVIADLNLFLKPILEQLNFLVYFHLHDCAMFRKHLMCQMAEISTSSEHTPKATTITLALPGVGIQQSPCEANDRLLQFVAALRNTREFILSIINGTAKYEDIFFKEESIQKFDAESEVNVLCGFPEFKPNEEGKEGIKHMLELCQYSPQILKIPDVCSQYHLVNCENDAKLTELIEIVNNVETAETRAKITGKDATDYMRKIQEILKFTNSSIANKSLKLFTVVANCTEFYQFIQKKGFINDRAAFNSQVELITAQLQHEDYNEAVLNHLTSAFKYISPFLDTKQNFSQLMAKISRLCREGAGFGRDPQKHFCQLETVNSNITMIQLWFSRAEGDTLENVSKELKRIMENGHFKLIIKRKQIIYISKMDGGGLDQCHSKFVLHCKVQKLSCASETWNNEQIDDFVRKLGFLESQQATDVDQQVKVFQQLNQIAQKYYHILLKLRDLGHSEYVEKEETIACSTKIESAESMVANAERTLENWRSAIRDMYKKYDKLLFFSVPKILSLHKVLVALDLSVDKKVDEMVDKMAHEIGVLFENDPEAIKKLKTAIRATVKSTQSFQDEIPFEIVGKYLGQLCNEESIADHLLFSRNQPSKGKLFQEMSVHFAPNYDNGQLLCLLIKIYNGVPESYEVFQCDKNTREEDLKLFLNRASEFRSRTFTILEINMLPYELQELILQHHLQEAGKTMESAIHLHYIETAASILHEMPWIAIKDHKEDGPDIKWEDAKRICKNYVNKGNMNYDVELVYGCSGDGKTHYIRKQLYGSERSQTLNIAVNESFTPLNAILKLRSLPRNECCKVYFNFTVVNTAEEMKYRKFMNTLAWFFFKLLVYEYIEDLETGIAFRLPGGHHWRIYVEVPSLHENAQDNLDWIYNEMPILNLVGKPVCIEKERHYDINPSVQLVCKYLNAYKNRADKKRGINKLFNEKLNKKVSFGDDPNVSYDQCHILLKEHMPAHVTANKVLQHLFIKYMERRCKFMEDYPAFCYNTGAGAHYDHEKFSQSELKKMVNDKILVKTKEAYYTNAEKLGELLMETMLQEVDEFCKMDIQQNWEAQTHQQLIYEKEGCIKLLTLKPEEISAEKAFKLSEIIKAEVPTMSELLGREKLDSYLSFALGVPLKDKRLQDIDDAKYVLTLDYTVKMLNIHERRECGIPVIIQGETGVGKTELINMLSKLWNHALIKEWRAVKRWIIEDILYRKSSEQENDDLNITLEQLDATWHNDKAADKYLTEEELIPLLELHQTGDTRPYFEFVNEELEKLIKKESIFELMYVDSETKDNLIRDHNGKLNFNNREDSAVSYLINNVKEISSAQATAKLLCTILNGNLISTFYKLNIHAALSPKEIQDFFIPIVKLAEHLLKIHEAKMQETKKQEINKPPVVTVFLDEVNTSSCMGLLKEIIIDKTFDGEPLPTNIFLVAACNPHRGNSLAVHENSKESWIRGSYYVQQLHPTMRFLMWDYGSLNDEQELAYIKAKMVMANEDFTIVQNMRLSELIVECQKLMRKYASEQLRCFGLEDNEAKLYATSCVSQRDIQRVFTFYEWIIKTYNALQRSSTEETEHPVIVKNFNQEQMKHQALLVSLGLVYYMRLNSMYRERFTKELDKINFEVKFLTAFMEEMDFYTDKLDLPAGIAKTEALKENLFATIICTVTKTPLIIVGAPGSSKTLSFNLTISKLKGQESKQKFFRNIEVFKSLDPHYYQCSRRTTSTEIETVFQRAINRQRSHEKFSMPIRCVVFMDEAGLPEESLESLKVLHYHLDQQEVAFVAITNHILDAAKTNRAVSLFRPTASQKDLETLAKGCLCNATESPPQQSKESLKIIEKFCFAYCTIMRNTCIERIFGLRDFIHFINYIRRKGKSRITPQLVLQSLERNFNGTKEFDYICSVFLREMEAKVDDLKKRNVIEILKCSLRDNQLPSGHDTQNEVASKQTASDHDTQSEVAGKQTASRGYDTQNEAAGKQTTSGHDTQSEVAGKQTASNHDTQSEVAGKQTASSYDTQNEVRYKLIIDPSEDESIAQLFFMFGILKRKNTRTYICSDFHGDGQLQKINTIAAIRHSAVAGHTVILSQTDDIHESFYDLFNLNFRKIDDPETGNARYFTNISIGAHLKPSKVDLKFQCIVVVKESEIKNTPAPFLNRFEKYIISHTNLLDLVFDKLPPCLKVMAEMAYKKVQNFYSLLGPESFYGGKNVTVCSLMLSILPKPGHQYTSPKSFVTTEGLTNEALLLQNIVKFLHELGGFCYMKSSLKELQHDAKCIISLLANTGSEFSGVVKTLKSCKPTVIFQWIVESLDLIYSQPEDPDPVTNDRIHGHDGNYEPLGASNEACMVTAVITQWIVRFMCKKLMQLMTPEAAILKRKCIPVSYFETYLNYQTHFGLKELIEKHSKMFDQCNNDEVATKVICYTRSTSSIHQLPPVFPSKSFFSAEELQKFKTCIEDFICKEVDNVFLCKLSSASSQTVFKSRLQEFMTSQQQSILVLVINMQETTNQIINHIRIMIEEVECTKRKSKKLFFLLLHFPATMFYDPCYPSLFLCGWDHHYLDTIDQISTDQDNSSLIDIQEWFRQSCLSSQEITSPTKTDDSMLQPLLNSLRNPESILIIASRILLNIDSNDLTLDSTPDIAVKAEYLKKLLFDKKNATDKNVATVLCLKFISYWGPSVVGNHLEQAAAFSKSRESSLNVSDYVESMYRSAFFNFIAYMLYQISKSRSLNILFSDDCDNATLNLFLKLLDAFPIPKLAEIKAYNHTWDCRIHAIGRTGYVPQFPFFVKVSTQICNMVEESMAKINESIDILQDTESLNEVGSCDLQSKEQMFKKLYEYLCTRAIKEQHNVKEKRLCTTAIEEMKNDEKMWQKYYNDFSYYYLHLYATPDSLEHRLLHLTFTNTLLKHFNEMKAIAAHCYLHLFQLNLAKVVASLKPLRQLHVLKLSQQPSYPKYSEDSLITALEVSPNEFGTSKFGSGVSKLLINLLFENLVNVISSEDASYRLASLQKWFNAYRDMMLAINTAVLNEQLNAKCHLMEVTFLVLLSLNHITCEAVECACVLVQHLRAKYFTDDLQFKDSEPLNLKEIVTAFNMTLQNSQLSKLISIPQFYQHVMEGIFTHFFPDTDDSTVYSKDDIEFFFKFANGQNTLKDVNQIIYTDDQSKSFICFSKLKPFLDRILCKGWTKNGNNAQHMTFYKLETCVYVGQIILSQYSEATLSEYIPLYLQKTTKKNQDNPVMNEALIHLYFYTILEKLQTHQFTSLHLVKIITETKKKSTDVSDNAMKLIAIVEMQALLEALLCSVANDLENRTNFLMLLSMPKDLNDYIKDESHYDILLMHLIKKYHGLKTVMGLLQEKSKEPLNCLKSIKEKLEASPPSTSHQFPFVAGSPTAENKFSKMYREICNRLQITGSYNSFLNYVKPIIKSNDKKRSTVHMMIWLCVYYEFYCTKKRNPELIDFLNEAQEDLGLSKEHLCILSCFLDPERNMIKGEEAPNPSNFNAEVLEYTKEGNIVPKQPPSNVPKSDPIWEFFVNPDEDSSDIELRHALANMIAVVFGLPAQTTHLWYHMFAPKDIENSYLTGFMYPNVVKEGGLMYDCGCELNEVGNYGRSDYDSRTLSLHSWYLLLWCNFGAFCIGLLTQPTALEQIKGHIISDWMSIRHYCIAQLRTVWLYMRSNMSFGDEERSFFVMRSMYKLFTLFQQGEFPYPQGRFFDLSELNKYENSWHKLVYEPSKNSLKYELEKHSSHSVWALPVLKNFRILEQHYPHLATESDYMKSLNDDREANNCNPTHLFVLHQFTQERRILQIGGALLPDLVEFYQWIHTELSHLVTYQKAEQISIGTIIKNSARRHSQEYSEHLTELFKRVKRKYNEYLEINGGIVGTATCNRAPKPTDVHTIDENTELRKLISLEDTNENDWLYIVIMDVIRKHNTFLNSIFAHVKTSDCHYKKYLPDKFPELHPTEITIQSCICPSNVSDQDQFLKLINNHYVYNGTWSIDLNQLEQDIVEIYIVGKPLIAIDSSIRTVFRFKNMPTDITQPGSNGGCAIDISAIAQELPKEYKERLLDETSKRLEIDFHTESYHTFSEIVDGLRTIIGHLIQYILQRKHKTWDPTLNIKLVNYLQRFFSKNLNGIGIKRINVTQQKLLENIEMKRLFHCLELFVGWLQGGLYDFSSLPLSLFNYLKDGDMDIIMNVHTKYSSTDMDCLLSELNDFEKLLNHAENHLTKEENLELSITELLRDLGLFESTEKFVSLIPQTILVCHYVHFRMTLRKLKITVTALIHSQPQKSLVTSNKWTEIIEDLWQFLPLEKYWYDDHCLKFDCVRLQFGDQEENDNDSETWPQQNPSDAEDACEEASEIKTEVNKVVTGDQHETVNSIKDEMLQQFEENPEFREVVMKTLASNQTASTASIPMTPSIPPSPAKQPSDKAMNMTTAELCQWLKELKIPVTYIEYFEKEEIDGSQLAEYKEEHLDFISEPRIRIRILTKFRKI